MDQSECIAAVARRLADHVVSDVNCVTQALQQLNDYDLGTSGDHMCFPPGAPPIRPRSHSSHSASGDNRPQKLHSHLLDYVRQFFDNYDGMVTVQLFLVMFGPGTRPNDICWGPTMSLIEVMITSYLCSGLLSSDRVGKFAFLNLRDAREPSLNRVSALDEPLLHMLQWLNGEVPDDFTPASVKADRANTLVIFGSDHGLGM